MSFVSNIMRVLLSQARERIHPSKFQVILEDPKSNFSEPPRQRDHYARLSRRNRVMVRNLGCVALVGVSVVAGKTFLNAISRNSTDSTRNSTNGLPALSAAIDGGEVQEAQRLLNSGADPNQRDEFGNPPLWHAIDKNDVGMVKMLADHGADLKATWGFDNENGVQRAAWNNTIGTSNIYILNTMLALPHHPDINAVNKFGDSALDIAVKHRDVPAVIMLKKYGARITNWGKIYREIKQKPDANPKTEAVILATLHKKDKTHSP